MKIDMRIIAMLFFAMVFLSACKQNDMSYHETVFAFRLKPGDDLQKGIEQIVKQHNIKAGWINTCVGSLTNYQIRFANQTASNSDSGHFEIVSLVGTLSVNGSHIHLSVSDSTGKTIGGHLMEGCKIYTTAEIVISSTDRFDFERAEDGTTPWKELQIKVKSEK
jgi:predicted DNA-binding protein with PD1-like motif